MESLEGKTSGTPSPDSVSTKLKRIAEVARVDAWRTNDPRSRMRESRTSGSVGGLGGSPPRSTRRAPGMARYYQPGGESRTGSDLEVKVLWRP